MIYFETNHQKLFNYLIHHFLEIECLEEIEQIDLSWYIPSKFLEENEEKCLETIKEIYYWTNDNTKQKLGPFHEYVLYHFLKELSELQDELDDFNEIYFDNTAIKLMKEAIKEDYEYEEEVINYEEYQKEMLKDYRKIYDYSDALFRDLDFCLIDDIYNNHKKGDLFLEKKLGIDLDYYFELLPKDIQNQYKTGHICLHGDLKEMLTSFKNKIEYGNLSKLFWNNLEAKKLEQIEILLDNLMVAYFVNQEIELKWKKKIENNILNFTFVKRFEENEKYLLSFQIPVFENLTESLREEFFKVCKNYEQADFIFLCFTNEDYNNVNKFIDNYIYTSNLIYYLNVWVYDLRPKVAPSKKK